MADTVIVDARGLSCPQPVLATKKALEKLAGKRSVNLLGAKMYGEDLVNRERIGFLNWKKFAAAEQRAGAAQILDALRMINEITSQVRVGSREMSAGNGIVLDEMARLQASAAEIREDMDETASGAEEIRRASRSVSESAGSTRETIERLEAAICCFKTGQGC